MIERWVTYCQARPRRILAVCALLLAAQVGPWWYSTTDSTGYLSMARSLARGTGLKNLGSPLLWYSPGYSALVCPLFLLNDRPFLLIGVVQWLLAVGLMLGVYYWGRRVSAEAAVWFAALTVVNHGFWVHFRRPLSEMAFLCALIWTINLLHGLTGPWRVARYASQLAISAVLLAALCVIRPVGIMLAPALLVWVALEARRGRLGLGRALAASLIVVAAAVTPVALFVAHERALAAELGRRSYADNFHDAARSPWESYSRGAQLCVSDIGRVCLPGFFKSHGAPGDWRDPNMLVHVPFFLFVCHGWRLWRRCDNDLYQWYVPFYLLLIMAHAMDAGARLLLPLLPALMVCVWLALGWLGERRKAVVGVCLAAQLLVGGGYWLAFDLPRTRQFHRQWPLVDKLAAQIRSGDDDGEAESLPHELQRMLELTLDRPLATHHSPLTTLHPSPSTLLRTARLGTGGPDARASKSPPRSVRQ